MTWTMTRHARTQAAEKAITDAEIARVLAGPDTSTTDPEEANVVTFIRSGLVLVTDTATKTVLAVIEVNPRARAVQVDDLSPVSPVRIRRRPVSNRPAPAPSFPLVTSATPSVLVGVNARRRPAATPAPTAPAASPVRKSAPVDSRVLDGVHPAIAAGVKEELKRRGLDFRHVVVYGPTHVEIH